MVRVSWLYLGFVLCHVLAPVVNHFKIFLRELFKAKIDWDQLLCGELMEEWNTLSLRLQVFETIIELADQAYDVPLRWSKLPHSWGDLLKVDCKLVCRRVPSYPKDLLLIKLQPLPSSESWGRIRLLELSGRFWLMNVVLLAGIRIDPGLQCCGIRIKLCKVKSRFPQNLLWLREHLVSLLFILCSTGQIVHVKWPL